MTLAESMQTSVDLTAAYDPLAPAYDAFTGNGDYGAWALGLLDEVARHGIRGGQAVEVGCGTGRTTVAPVARGFDVWACDPSPAMLERARRRLRPGVTLAVGGLPELPSGPSGSVTLALNDIINSIPPALLDDAVTALAARTAPGGVVLFDVNTRSVYDDGFFATTFVRRADGHMFVWEPVSTGVPGAHRADLHVFTPHDDAPECRHVVSTHRHWHHPHANVISALQRAGLEPLVALGQHDDGRRDPHFDEDVHLKRVYLARRP